MIFFIVAGATLLMSLTFVMLNKAVNAKISTGEIVDILQGNYGNLTVEERVDILSTVLGINEADITNVLRIPIVRWSVEAYLERMSSAHEFETLKTRIIEDLKRIQKLSLTEPDKRCNVYGFNKFKNINL